MADRPDLESGNLVGSSPIIRTKVNDVTDCRGNTTCAE